MLVMKAFEGNGKSWFLFLEVKRVAKEGENLQIQCVDSSKNVQCLANGFDPLLGGPSSRLPDIDELDHQQKSDHCLVTSKPSVYLSDSDKQRPADFDRPEVEHNSRNHPLVRYPDSDAVVENISAECQKVSNPKLPEKEKYMAISSEFADGITRNEDNVVQQEDPNLVEGAGTELATTAKRKHKSKRKARSWDENAIEGNHDPSGASALASASNTHENTESNADKATVDVVGNGNNEFEHRDSEALLTIKPSVTVRENSDIRVNSVEAGGDVGQLKDSENLVEDANLQTPAKKRRKVEKKTRKDDSVSGSVGSMLNTNKTISKPEALSPRASSLGERPKAPNLDAPETVNDRMEANNGLSVSPTADKKKKRKKSSKDPNKSAAATTSSIDIFDGNHGVSGNIDCAIVGPEIRAILPPENRDETLTAAIEKETEMAILSSADNLQTDDFTTTPLPLVQESKKPDPVDENYSDQNIGNNDKNATPVDEIPNLGTFTTKDDGEGTGKRDDGEVNADETKGAKSSKRKRKSSKAKTPVEDSRIGISSTEPVKAVRGEGADIVIRNVLESLQQGEGNEEKSEKGEKKSRKRTKKKQPSDNAAEETALVAPIVGLKETVSGSSKPLKKAKPGKTGAVGQSSRTIADFENDTSISKMKIEAENDIAHHKLEKRSKALIPDACNTSAARTAKNIKEARLSNVSESIQANTKGSTEKKETVKSLSTKEQRKNTFPASGAIFGNSSSEEDEPKVSGASTRTPSDASSDYSDEESDAAFASEKLGTLIRFGPTPPFL
ncbi:PREDICTED: uncharacterized protein LOC104825539 isoform X2 [Tarenaya hassleriana]|nr:PREDICTED: uncharacterized protein LOC104825539 isoform X2 [Tarenaya hassleriana]